MKTHRISTTISQKHWELLKKYAEKYETQQRALELALESLENSKKQSPALTPEEDYLIRLTGKIAVYYRKKSLQITN